MLCTQILPFTLAFSPVCSLPITPIHTSSLTLLPAALLFSLSLSVSSHDSLWWFLPLSSSLPLVLPHSLTPSLPHTLSPSLPLSHTHTLFHHRFSLCQSREVRAAQRTDIHTQCVPSIVLCGDLPHLPAFDAEKDYKRQEQASLPLTCFSPS